MATPGIFKRDLNTRLHVPLHAICLRRIGCGCAVLNGAAVVMDQDAKEPFTQFAAFGLFRETITLQCSTRFAASDL